MYSIIFLTSRLFHVAVAFYDNQTCIRNTCIYKVKEGTDSQCMYMSFVWRWEKKQKFTTNAALIAKIYNRVYLISILITISIFQQKIHVHVIFN